MGRIRTLACLAFILLCKVSIDTVRLNSSELILHVTWLERETLRLPVQHSNHCAINPMMSNACNFDQRAQPTHDESRGDFRLFFFRNKSCYEVVVLLNALLQTDKHKNL